MSPPSEPRYTGVQAAHSACPQVWIVCFPPRSANSLRWDSSSSESPTRPKPRPAPPAPPPGSSKSPQHFPLAPSPWLFPPQAAPLLPFLPGGTLTQQDPSFSWTPRLLDPLSGASCPSCPPPGGQALYPGWTLFLADYRPRPPLSWLGPVALFAHLLVHPPASADPVLLGGGWKGEGDRWDLLKARRGFLCLGWQ